jgi:hypothetical protein
MVSSACLKQAVLAMPELVQPCVEAAGTSHMSFADSMCSDSQVLNFGLLAAAAAAAAAAARMMLRVRFSASQQQLARCSTWSSSSIRWAHCCSCFVTFVLSW